MLTLTSKFAGLAAAAAVAACLSGTASAATVTFGALPASAVANPLATTTSGTVIQNVSTDTVGTRLGPWAGSPPVSGDPGQVYTSVAKGFAEYAFGKLMRELSFVWGTPDKFNEVRFYRGGALVDVIDGFGNGGNGSMPTLTATKIDGGKGFDTVRFSSGPIAFEYANLTVAPVPVPAAGLLLLGALGGMAALRRRKSV